MDFDLLWIVGNSFIVLSVFVCLFIYFLAVGVNFPPITHLITEQKKMILKDGK